MRSGSAGGGIVEADASVGGVPGSGEEGTGLGLAIVQRIAERHAAQVFFLRGNEGGLRVEIVFPGARTERRER